MLIVHKLSGFNCRTNLGHVVLKETKKSGGRSGGGQVELKGAIQNFIEASVSNVGSCQG